VSTYTTQEVAHEAGISEQRVRVLATRLKLGRKHGAAWLFDDNDVWALKQDRRAGWPRGRARKAQAPAGG
jgi:hypothetical protein